MIGTSIRGTLFYIEFAHRTLTGAAGTEQAVKRGEQYVVSADPSGADLYEVAQAAVLNGSARPEHEFTLVHVKRCCEIKGRAIAAGGAN